jgi:hypothetical protein
MNKNSKTCLIIILVYAGFILLGVLTITSQLIFIPALRSPVFLPSPLVSYKGENWPFTIEHPKIWNVHEFADGDHNDQDVIVMINPPGKSQPRVEIASKEIQSRGMEYVIQWGIERAKRCSSFEFGTQNEIRVSNMDAVQFDYRCQWRQFFFSSPNIAIHCTDYFLMKDSSAYDISFCVPVNQEVVVLPLYEQMLQSFVLR